MGDVSGVVHVEHVVEVVVFDGHVGGELVAERDAVAGADGPAVGAGGVDCLGQPVVGERDVVGAAAGVGLHEDVVHRVAVELGVADGDVVAGEDRQPLDVAADEVVGLHFMDDRVVDHDVFRRLAGDRLADAVVAAAVGTAAGAGGAPRAAFDGDVGGGVDLEVAPGEVEQRHVGWVGPAGRLVVVADDHVLHGGALDRQMRGEHIDRARDLDGGAGRGHEHHVRTRRLRGAVEGLPGVGAGLHLHRFAGGGLFVGVAHRQAGLGRGAGVGVAAARGDVQAGGRGWFGGRFSRRRWGFSRRRGRFGGRRRRFSRWGGRFGGRRR